MIWLSLVVWLLNCVNDLNGSAHRSTERSSFSGQEIRPPLTFITRYDDDRRVDLTRRSVEMWRESMTSNAPS